MRYYTKEYIYNEIKKEEPNISDHDATQKAILIHRALNTHDISWRRSCKKFNEYNVMQGIDIQFKNNIKEKGDNNNG
jgi:hypothetical protein